MSHRAWLRLNERRHRLRRAWTGFFRDQDVLLCPTIATAAFRHMQEGETWERRITIEGRDMAYNDMLFWPGLIGGYHLPATVAPMGFTARACRSGCRSLARSMVTARRSPWRRCWSRSFWASPRRRTLPDAASVRSRQTTTTKKPGGRHHEAHGSGRATQSRRGLLRGAAATVGSVALGRTVLAQQPAAPVATPPSVITNPPRQWGRNAPPAFYPDPDVIVIDNAFRQFIIGNTGIHRVE